MKRLNRVDRLINWETAFLTYHVLLSIGARDGNNNSKSNKRTPQGKYPQRSIQSWPYEC